MIREKVEVKSPCGAADLLAVIFGVKPDTVRGKYGLPLKHPVKKPIKYTISLVCDQCGKLFERREKYVLFRMTHSNRFQPSGQQHQFCNKTCFGKWAGKHCGFGAHPENIGYRKWDYDMVWQKHIETGYGALRLSRLLNIPVSTLIYILEKAHS